MYAKGREVAPLRSSHPGLKYDPNFHAEYLVRSAAGGELAPKLKSAGEEKKGQVEKKKLPSDPKKRKNLINEVRSYLKDLSITIDFSISDDTGDLTVKLLDSETGEVVRRIPLDELVKLREKSTELRGVLFDDKA